MFQDPPKNCWPIGLVALLVVATSQLATAQGDFFWSFADLNSGATNSAAEGTFVVGDTGRLFLYYSTMNSELDTGAGLDITSTISSVINFTLAETLDFDVCLDTGTQCIGGPRWGDSFGEAQQVGLDEIIGLNAFSVVAGTGILNENTTGPIIDQGYDEGANAFLFARIDFIATAVGSTNLETVAGAIGIVHNGQTVSPTFGNAAIHVVPEPASFGVLTVLVVVAAWRRKIG